jgi:long-subunit fatty acid transport protein
MKKLILGLLIVLLFPLNADSRVDTAAEFMTFGVGARPSGMGEAFVSICNEADAVYWNPAGLAFLKDVSLVAMYSRIYERLFEGMSHSFIAVSNPISDRLHLGFGVVYLTSGTHQITVYDETERAPKTVGQFKTYDLAGILSLSVQAKENLSLGASLKYLYSDLWQHKGRAYAVDMGFLYKGPFKGLNFGLNIENAGTKMHFKDREQADPLPFNLRAGLSIDIPIGENLGLLLSCDANKSLYDIKDKFLGINIGGEFRLLNTLFARLGYFDKDGGVKGQTYGVGFRIKNLRLDFANIPASEMKGADRTTRISLAMRF